MNIKQLLATCLTATALFTSCSDSPDGGTPEPIDTSSSLYSVWVTSASGSYLLTTNDLMKDTLLTPQGNKGIDITSHLPAAFYAIYAYNYDGKFYLSNDGTRLSQFEVQNGSQWKETNSYIFGSTFYIGKVLDNISTTDELVMTKTAGTTNKTKNVLEQPIYFMNTSTLKINKTLNIEIPMINYVPKQAGTQTNDDPYIVPTSFTVRGNQLFVGHKYRSNITKTDIIDTAYVYVCDYPALTNGKIIKTANGGFTAGHWEVNKTTFLDDNNDLYIMTRLVGTSKYGLVRIKAGESDFDKDYFFDLKDYNVFTNSASTIQKLGNGKAYIAPYVVDPANKKIIADLRILAGGGEPKTTMNFMENGKLYDVFKTDESKWFVFEYDPETNTMQRGAEIDSGVTWVYHVNKLK
ncbi:DUF4374 domain-containing protein [Sphingobacterium sp. LRF_L2]|uniref:DUF4374 domain-containing protein n=1 Tax=Sphingobacterium sp. LRF_L2 TaxID=3369421 RepID=UPI003F603396